MRDTLVEERLYQNLKACCNHDADPEGTQKATDWRR